MRNIWRQCLSKFQTVAESVSGLLPLVITVAIVLNLLAAMVMSAGRYLEGITWWEMLVTVAVSLSGAFFILKRWGTLHRLSQ